MKGESSVVAMALGQGSKPTAAVSNFLKTSTPKNGGNSGPGKSAQQTPRSARSNRSGTGGNLSSRSQTPRGASEMTPEVLRQRLLKHSKSKGTEDALAGFKKDLSLNLESAKLEEQRQLEAFDAPLDELSDDEAF